MNADQIVEQLRRLECDRLNMPQINADYADYALIFAFAHFDRSDAVELAEMCSRIAARRLEPIHRFEHQGQMTSSRLG